MLFIVFWKVMSWKLLFHLLFWCHKIIFSETSYGMVFGTISRYWEQTLTIFDDVLHKETAHAQLGHLTRKSWKALKNSVPWEKCQSNILWHFFHGTHCSRQLWVVFWIIHSTRHRYATRVISYYPPLGPSFDPLPFFQGESPCLLNGC